MAKPMGIRAAPTHTENPFLKGSEVQITGRKKRYTVASRGDTVLGPSGELKAGIEHTIVRVVDDAQFVKVFADGIAGLYDLRSAGSKVFRFLFDQVQQHPNVDRLYLYFMDAMEEPWQISKPVFFRGMAELLEKRFIARSANPNMFYLNPAMLWNGDRFRFVQEYQRAKRIEQMSSNIGAPNEGPWYSVASRSQGSGEARPRTEAAARRLGREAKPEGPGEYGACP